MFSNSTQKNTFFFVEIYLAAAGDEVLQQLHTLADLLPPHLKRVSVGNHVND
jgi:hypothetical protein